MACDCEIIECVRVAVNPCSPGTELPIESTITGNVTVSIEFNGATSVFQVAATEGDNIVLPTSALNEKYTHRMEMQGQCYEIRTSPAISGGGSIPVPPPASGNAWQWGDVEASGVIVTSPLLTGELAPIMWVSEQPIDWANHGVTWDPVTGELDFSSMGGIFGKIYFQYRNT